MNNNNVVAVFGQFAVQVDGKTKMFDTEVEANNAAVLASQGEEFLNTALSFTKAIEVEGKQAKQQQNVIVAYLAWQTNRDAKSSLTQEGTDF